MGLTFFTRRRWTAPSTCTQQTRHAAWLFVLFVVAVNLPNLLWLQPSTNLLLNAAEYMERLVLCLLLAACFLCLFSRPWLAWLCLWMLFLWWQPIAIGVRAIAGTPITATLIGTAMATSPAELRNLLTSIPWLWFALFVLWNVLCWLCLRWIRQRETWYWGASFRGKTAFFCLAILSLPYIALPDTQAPPASTQTARQASQTQHHLATENPLFALDQADQTMGGSAHLPDAFPYELPWAVVQYSQARRAIYAIRSNLQKPAREYSMIDHHPAAEVVVLVIGESSTRNAWHWFNPQAPSTTPQLEARAARGEHLFGFVRTLAQSTATRQAVPSMLTAQPLVWPNGTPNPQATLSIVSVAAEAGYATAWFSNQAAVGKHDGIIASYADEAATTAFLNPSGFYAQGNYDAVLLPALQRHLATHQRAFVVLHTMGSHFNYLHRYPAGFGLYPDSKDAREAYFNSVAYTDSLLDSIIEMLAQNGRKAVLVYASDHGESIPGGSCNAGVANRNTRDAYEVPALVWLSSHYAAAWPHLAQQLKANADQPYTVAAVPQTLLDLMRGDAQAALPDPGVQSFVRTTIEANGEIPIWLAKFEDSVQRTPCFMIMH